jgi:hypothetical protein
MYRGTALHGQRPDQTEAFRRAQARHDHAEPPEYGDGWEPDEELRWYVAEFDDGELMDLHDGPITFSEALVACTKSPLNVEPLEDWERASREQCEQHAQAARDQRAEAGLSRGDE